jgi:hypothetical protein
MYLDLTITLGTSKVIELKNKKNGFVHDKLNNENLSKENIKRNKKDQKNMVLFAIMDNLWVCFAKINICKKKNLKALTK